jgi:perosamine synthetase
MISTENEGYADRMRMMSLHGISRDPWRRHTAEESWYYEILHPGYKYNLTDIAAAIGIQQLKKCERFWQVRQRYANLYSLGFRDLPEVTVPHVSEEVQHSWHLYVIQLDLQRLRITRSEFIELLKKENIGTSVHFIPLHLHPFYRQTYGYRPEDFPTATRIFERTISLPLYPKMTETDVRDVIEAVRRIVAQYRR